MLFSQTTGVFFDFECEFYPAIKDDNGAEGLKNTMLSLFEYCLDIGYNKVLVFEDDAVVNEATKEQLQACIDELPLEFDMLKFGANLLSVPEKYSDNLYRSNGTYATHAVLYSKKAMQYICYLLRGEDTQPYDIILRNNIETQKESYLSKRILINQRKCVSNIFQYNPEKHQMIGRYYDIKTGEMDWGLFMQDQWDKLTKNI